jgi:hypothetical protein
MTSISYPELHGREARLDFLKDLGPTCHHAPHPRAEDRNSQTAPDTERVLQ